MNGQTEVTAAPIPSSYVGERVTHVHHWTDRLFSFRCTRNAAFRFEAGQFTMIGLMAEGRPLVRAYSMASASWEEELEFFSIKVANGPLTSRLQYINVGDTVLVSKKSTGTLVVPNLTPGRTLWMLSTGTGLAPFLSVLREPSVYEKFERVVISHTVREVRDLAYREMITSLPKHELLGDLIGNKLHYYPAVTREPFAVQERITTLIESGRIFRDLGCDAMNPEHDRVMLCGSDAMNTDCRRLLEDRGFEEGNNGEPGTYVLERAFVTK